MRRHREVVYAIAERSPLSVPLTAWETDYVFIDRPRIAMQEMQQVMEATVMEKIQGAFRGAIGAR